MCLIIFWEEIGVIVGKLRNGNSAYVCLYLCEKIWEVNVLSYNFVSKIPGNFIHGITKIDIKVGAIFNNKITTD